MSGRFVRDIRSVTPGNRTESLGKGMRGSFVVLPLLEPIAGYDDALSQVFKWSVIKSSGMDRAQDAPGFDGIVTVYIARMRGTKGLIY